MMLSTEGEKEMKYLKHIGHRHSLILVEYKSRASKEAESSGAADHDTNKSITEYDEKEEEVRCFACGEVLEGTIIYSCMYTCKFHLHEACALLKLELTLLNHPFHPSHTLSFMEKSRSYRPHNFSCNFCGMLHFGFRYNCYLCDFDLDIPCCLLLQSPSSIEKFHKLEYPLHPHPLTFIEGYNKGIHDDCSACMKELSTGLSGGARNSNEGGPPLTGLVYKCLECNGFYLHKECTELPLEIDHPYHPKHPLKLLTEHPEHPETLSCSLCDRNKDWEGFVYYCSVCMFGVTLEDALTTPNNITTAMGHRHDWILLSRVMSFVCDFCGTEGDRGPHLCTTCNLVVHKDCISLPRTIRITRHRHRISHTYSLHRKRIESNDCRICYNEVDVDCGSYACSLQDCDYIAHVKCATHEEIWDGNDDEEEEEEETDESTLISAVIEEIEQGGVMIATEIKHEYHDHNLTLTLADVELEPEEAYCDGCMRLIVIDTPFYSCGEDECHFYLHKECAELHRKKYHPSHIHPLTLANYDYSFCNACHRYHHGYSYECHKFCDYMIDIQCSSLADSLIHPSHEHRLFLDIKYHDGCSGCLDTNTRQIYVCVKRCGFTLDFYCLTLPQVARFKYEKHTLALTYKNTTHFDPSQLYCDICEEERDPYPWFYYCEECDTTVHSKCVLGALPYVKLETLYDHKRHPHYLTFVDNIWHCRPCIVCNKLCFRQALECKESDECNIIVHWNCRRSLGRPTRDPAVAIALQSQAS